jgi:hypothetical protein
MCTPQPTQMVTLFKSVKVQNLDLTEKNIVQVLTASCLVQKFDLHL